MDIKWKKYSHSLSAKIIAFLITIVSFTIAITLFLDIVGLRHDDFEIVFEESYYLGREYIQDSSQIIGNLTTLINFKSEENVLNGGTITEAEVKRKEDNLFSEFKHSKRYNPNLSYEENYKLFQEAYDDKITQIKDELIQTDLRDYNNALRELGKYQGLFYYVSDGDNTFTNGITNKDYVKKYSSYMIFDKSEQTVYPEEIAKNNHYYWIVPDTSSLEQTNDTALYIAFTDQFLEPRIKDWQRNKEFITNSLYRIIGLLSVLAISFIYLLVIIGRKPEDEDVHLNSIDKLYSDFNIALCLLLTGLWVGAISVLLFENRIIEAVFPITLVIGALGLMLVLSLVKHIKNGTIIKHSLTYTIFHKLFKFVKDVYNTGSVGVKIVLIVIAYPLLVALTFFIFPITIGIGAWLALKKVKEFNAIKEGVERVKNGEINHKIALASDGEFAGLAANINSITDGLNKAVDNQLKSERLKTELIANVSHDIRTPLTAIITYVDLLKKEKDLPKSEEYIEIIDQKSQRLKMLTDDLFEASKASSGNIPVNSEQIDIVSLITQGLGELDDRIKEHGLEFKVNCPKGKVYIEADGKLLWRAIENLLSNIFKYALEGSRVYIDLEDLGTETRLTIKNISAHELNISANELMERFKRGDEARSSQGSGLGLSIAKSLIEIQQGSFKIEIDGDLFKAIIKMPK